MRGVRMSCRLRLGWWRVVAYSWKTVKAMATRSSSRTTFMVNLSLITRLNIMQRWTSRCVNLSCGRCQCFPCHSRLPFPFFFSKSLSVRNPRYRNSRFRLVYHIVKFLILVVFFFYIGLDGGGHSYYLLDGHSQGLRSSRHISQYLVFFFFFGLAFFSLLSSTLKKKNSLSVNW